MADDTRERFINPYTDFGFKKVFWDNFSVLKTAREKGEREGVLKEKMETMQRMKSRGFSDEEISEIVNLSVDEVKKMLK